MVKLPKKIPAKRGRPKKAHEEDGTFVADDKATPVNEAIAASPTRQAFNILMGINPKSIGVQNALKILQREI